MGKDERKGARRNRNQQVSRRIPELGYYFVVTDAKETEINYLQGFHDSIPPVLHDRLVIKVNKARTHELINKCLEMAAVEPQYRKPWIVFDCDEVTDFDQIIMEAENRNIKTGWSNPCLEIWFLAYLGSMPVFSASYQCVDEFKTLFFKQVGQEYDKADENIYQKLCRFGNENNAIKIAKKRHQQSSDNYYRPSEMLSTTTVFELIEEIRNIIDAQN
jgi:hypothetical protein